MLEEVIIEGAELDGISSSRVLITLMDMAVHNDDFDHADFILEWRGVDIEITVKRA